jgi:predicted RNase H-like HicB family nuclease
MEFDAVYMKVPEGYIAFVEQLPGANSQGDTLDQARNSLREAVGLVPAAKRQLSEEAISETDVIRETLILPAA